MAYLEELGACVTRLNLSEEVETKAKNVLEQIAILLSDSNSKVKMKTWVACAIYVAVHDAVNTSEVESSDKVAYETTVSQLLVAAGINIMDFFQAMCCLKQNDRLSDSSKQSLIALERKYCIVSAIYDKFENMVGDVINTEGISQGSESQLLTDSFKSFAWYLFLVAKAKVFWHGQDLLATFHLLLCCIGEVIKATPAYVLLPPLDNIAATSNESLAILQVLSNMMNTAYDEVKVVYECWLHVAGELMQTSNLPELSDIKAKYQELYLQSGDIDEGLFLQRDWHVVPSSDACTHNSRESAVPTVRRTLDTMQALYAMLQSSPNDLSSSLKTLFKKCHEDPTPLIQRTVQVCNHKFTSAFADVSRNGNATLGKKRFELAVKYYYLMLDAMVRMEAERLSAVELTAFLKNETFHRSLLACCTEVVIMSCGSVGAVNFTPVSVGGNSSVQGIVFPWVLEVFELKAYHFFKVVESFIKTAPTITQQIINHLKHIEEKILLFLAWQSDSPVFDQFQPLGISSDRLHERLWSPCKSSTTSSTQNFLCSLSPAVNIFINKVSRLAGSRMKMLCSLLMIKEDLLDDIWVCIEHVLYKNNELLRDRHLDQIIMCCIYAVSKALNCSVSFKSIISCYMQLPHATETVYRKVLTNGRREYIITFYNNTFTSAIKDYIENQFLSVSKTSVSLNAVNSPLSPSYSIPGRRNIFISPLKQSPFKDPNEVMSQRTVHSYSIGSLNQPAKKLQAINEALRDIHTTSKNSENVSKDEIKGRKRLIFEVSSSFSRKRDDSPSFLSAKKQLKFD